MVKEEKKPSKVEMWLEFPPWEDVEYKDTLFQYF
jgi:hypothetical protein